MAPLSRRGSAAFAAQSRIAGFVGICVALLWLPVQAQADPRNQTDIETPTEVDGPGFAFAAQLGVGYYNDWFQVRDELSDGLATEATQSELDIDGPLITAALKAVGPWDLGKGVRPFVRVDFAIPPKNTEKAGAAAGALATGQGFGRVRYLYSVGVVGGVEVPVDLGPVPRLLVSPYAGVRIARFRLGNILDETGLPGGALQVRPRDLSDTLFTIGTELAVPLRARGRLRPQLFLDLSYQTAGNKTRSQNSSALAGSGNSNQVRFENQGALHLTAGVELRFSGL